MANIDQYHGIEMRHIQLCKVSPFQCATSQIISLFFPRFLKNAKKDHDLKKWAAEGLAYLSLDADVKEELVDDSQALKAIIQLAQVCWHQVNNSSPHRLILNLFQSLVLISNQTTSN